MPLGDHAGPQPELTDVKQPRRARRSLNASAASPFAKEHAVKLPVQVTFRGMARSAALEEAIQDRAAKLDRFHPSVVSCRAVVEEIARHKQQGKEFVVRLDIKVTGAEVAINRDHSEDAFVAVRDAFDAARRQLEDHARRMRGEVKSHARKRGAGKRAPD
jgi:ribosome-associated translation inhibitor RaiA